MYALVIQEISPSGLPALFTSCLNRSESSHPSTSLLLRDFFSRNPVLTTGDPLPWETSWRSPFTVLPYSLVSVKVHTFFQDTDFHRTVYSPWLVFGEKRCSFYNVYTNKVTIRPHHVDCTHKREGRNTTTVGKYSTLCRGLRNKWIVRSLTGSVRRWVHNWGSISHP